MPTPNTNSTWMLRPLRPFFVQFSGMEAATGETVAVDRAGKSPFLGGAWLDGKEVADGKAETEEGVVKDEGCEPGNAPPGLGGWKVTALEAG